MGKAGAKPLYASAQSQLAQRYGESSWEASSDFPRVVLTVYMVASRTGGNLVSTYAVRCGEDADPITRMLKRILGRGCYEQRGGEEQGTSRVRHPRVAACKTVVMHKRASAARAWRGIAVSALACGTRITMRRPHCAGARRQPCEWHCAAARQCDLMRSLWHD